MKSLFDISVWTICRGQLGYVGALLPKGFDESIDPPCVNEDS